MANSETFKRISLIRQEIQLLFFESIFKKIKSEGEIINRDNFKIFSKKQGYEGGDSYCNYVAYLRFNFLYKYDGNK